MSRPTVRYTLAISEPTRHLLDVTVEVDQVEGEVLEVKLPTWTPGSYLIREYARHVRDFNATAEGRALRWRKSDKLTWRIETGGARSVTISYRVYGHELTVRTNHVDSTHAHVIPAATFMFIPGCEQQPVELSVRAPDGWRIATGLDRTGGDPASFTAANFDQLVDSPLEIGDHRRLEFEVGGKPHALVIWGRGNEDEQQLVEDARKIVEAASEIFGPLPYDHYTFLLMLGGASAGGGLEHRNSTSLLLPRHVFRPRKSYERYLSLTAHEFIHTWNVKRLLPEGLIPFDYTTENYTRLLWLMEGVTEYYTDIVLRRAGLISPERYRERLAEDIVTLQTTPGRRVQSLEDSSFDTWIKFYRPDETTPNTSVSYYLKGALLGLCLDLEIRRRTDNGRSLDDVMRFLYETYALQGRGIPEEGGVERAVADVAGGDWAEFFARYVAGTDELPFKRALDAAGIALEWGYKDTIEGGDAPRPQLGARVKPDQGRLKVTHVLDGGSAAAAGLAPDDELVALDGWRIDDSNLKDRLADYRVGDTVTVAFFRRDELLHLPMTFLEPPRDKLTLLQVDDPDEQQRRIYESWMQTPWREDEKATATAHAGGSVATATDEVVRTNPRQPT